MLEHNHYICIPYSDRDIAQHCVITDIQIEPLKGTLLDFHMYVDPYKSPKDCYTLIHSGVTVPVLLYIDNYEPTNKFPRTGKDGDRLLKRVSDYWYDPVLRSMGQLCDLQSFFESMPFDTTDDVDKLETVFMLMRREYNALADQLLRLRKLVLPIVADNYTKQNTLRDVESLHQQCLEGSDVLETVQKNVWARAAQPKKFVAFDFIF